MWNEKNERNAKSVETLLRNLRNALPFETMNDMDERYNPIFGGSVWVIEFDNSITTHNTVGDVKATCLSPMRFIGQPNIYTIEDMEYCFLKLAATKEDIIRKYGVSESVAFSAENENDADEKTATLYVCYYKNEDDKVCEYVWSGDVELLEGLIELKGLSEREAKIRIESGTPIDKVAEGTTVDGVDESSLTNAIRNTGKAAIQNENGSYNYANPMEYIGNIISQIESYERFSV
jgi:hypothetical protein